MIQPVEREEERWPFSPPGTEYNGKCSSSILASKLALPPDAEIFEENNGANLQQHFFYSRALLKTFSFYVFMLKITSNQERFRLFLRCDFVIHHRLQLEDLLNVVLFLNVLNGDLPSLLRLSALKSLAKGVNNSTWVNRLLKRRVNERSWDMKRDQTWLEKEWESVEIEERMGWITWPLHQSHEIWSQFDTWTMIYWWVRPLTGTLEDIRELGESRSEV